MSQAPQGSTAVTLAADEYADLFALSASVLVETFRRLANATVDGPDGREHENPFVREVAYEMALDEMDAEPTPGDFPNTDEGASDYVDAVSRWNDVLDAVAADNVDLVSRVLDTAHRVMRQERNR